MKETKTIIKSDNVPAVDFGKLTVRFPSCRGERGKNFTKRQTFHP